MSRDHASETRGGPEYVGSAIAIGGREGTVRSTTGSFELNVVPPGATREGATPEELLAAAWAACFGGAFIVLGARNGLDAADAEIRAAVTLAHDVAAGTFSISRAHLDVALSSADQQLAERVLENAHRLCPISRLFEDGAHHVSVAIRDPQRDQ